MAKNLIFCFDGTSNDPSDSIEERGLRSIKDSSITNVLKLHLLFGGDLENERHVQGQHSFYFSGAGTRGGKVRRIFDTAFAPPQLSINQVMDAAHKIIDTHYKRDEGDQIFLFGFSRGAATARMFASQLTDEKPVRFIGVFDTVASIGKPRLKADGNPSSVEIFENGTVAPCIQEALHLVSIDETRKVFRPTLMNKEDRVTEIWFPGVHSDVGGGYREDGLSDGALRFMLDEFSRRRLGLVVRTLPEIPFSTLIVAEEGEDGEPYTIRDRDVAVDPDFRSRLHEHERLRLTTKLTLAARQVTVNVNDKPSESDRPVVHWTAAERIRGDENYRPDSLRAIDYALLNPDGSRESATGIDQIASQPPQLRTLLIGESAELACNALRFNNHSGVMLAAGAKYRFHVPTGQQWQDGGIPCSAEGWTREDIEEGFVKEAVIAGAELFRRVSDSNWFALMGSIGTDDSEVFEILAHTERPYIPSSSGEFCSFANDLNSKYENNAGRMAFAIERVG